MASELKDKYRFMDNSKVIRDFYGITARELLAMYQEHDYNSTLKNRVNLTEYMQLEADFIRNNV